MRGLYVFLVLVLCFGQSVSQTVVSDGVSGTWTASKSPYIAVKDIWVDGTLRIEPGVVVRFQAGGLKFSIGSGQLIARGTERDPIIFEPLQGTLPGLWRGITASNNWLADTLEYCDVRLAVIGIDVGSSVNGRCDPVILSRCDIHHNATNGVQSLATGGATAAVSDVRMTECLVHENGGYGVYQDRNGVVAGASGHPEATLIRCKIYKNGKAGVYQTTNGTSILYVYNCDIVKNASDGIAISGTATITNCIVAWNGGFGIAKVTTGSWLTTRDVLYNDVWQNAAGAYDKLAGDRFGYPVTTNVNGDSCDANFNLYADPLFKDTVGHHFMLTSGSPCIDGGTTYVGGSIVRDPDGSIPDIGVEYYDSILGVEGDAAGEPFQFTLFQNYPNPFNPVATIAYDLPHAASVSLAVYDILGQEVAVLVREYQAPGRYRAVFDASALPSGVYLYRLETSNGYTASKKMVFLK